MRNLSSPEMKEIQGGAAPLWGVFLAIGIGVGLGLLGGGAAAGLGIGTNRAVAERGRCC